MTGAAFAPPTGRAAFEQAMRDAIHTATRALSPKQIVSIDMARTQKIALWVGAVSGGKTIASLFALFDAVRHAPEGYPIVIIGKTLRTIEQNVLSQMQNRSLFGDLADLVVHTTGTSIAFVLGRKVELIGASNKEAVGRITGATYGLAYVDEAVLIPEGFWDMLVTRLRAPGSRMLATTNPNSRNHWLRQKWILQREKQRMVVFHFTMDDNPLYYEGGLVGPEYIADMKAAYAGVFYQRFILGLWTTAQGAIYDTWHAAKHVVPWADMPPIRAILGIGIDFGTTHASSAIMLGLTDEVDARGYPAPRLILMDEWRHESGREDANGIALPPMAPSVQAQNMIAWARGRHAPLGNPGHTMLIPAGAIYIDPAAPHLAEEFKRLGVQTWHADNDHAGIGTIMSLLTGDRPRLIVSDRCRGFIEEVTEYIWDVKAQEKNPPKDEPVRERDDSLDAGRYAVRSTMPVWEAVFHQAYRLAA